MPEHPLKRILSRILRASGDASAFQITYIHRGAPDDKAIIKASDISKIEKGSFLLKDGESQIPFHRVLTVQDLDTGERLWEKRTVARA